VRLAGCTVRSARTQAAVWRRCPCLPGFSGGAGGRRRCSRLIGCARLPPGMASVTRRSARGRARRAPPQCADAAGDRATVGFARCVTPRAASPSRIQGRVPGSTAHGLTHRKIIVQRRRRSNFHSYCETAFQRHSSQRAGRGGFAKNCGQRVQEASPHSARRGIDRDPARTGNARRRAGLQVAKPR
jgi:hypothetical protein